MKYLYIGVAALAAATQAPAQTQVASASLADLSLEQLGNIEVTSVAKRVQRLADVPGSVFVIRQEDIRRSGATTLPEVLRLAPNLQVARADANQYAITARGQNSTLANKMLVLIDGRTVYSPLFSGVFWEVQDVMLEDIERIEVLSGSGGTLYGSNAVNGVINIITRSAVDTHGLLTSVGAGNTDRVYSARYGGVNAAGFDWRIYAKRSHVDHTELPGGVAVRDKAAKSLAGFRADRIDGSDQLTFQGDAYQASIDQAPSARRLNGLNLLGRYTRDLGNGSQAQLQAYFDRTERDQPGSVRETLDTWDLEFQHLSKPLASHQLLWGAGYRSSNDEVTNISPTLAFYPAHKRLKLWNLFAQDEIQVAQRVKLTLGLKAEHNVYSGTELLPNARLAWEVAPNQLLWAAASRTARAPSRIDIDLYSPRTPPFTALNGGPIFEAEVARVYELGYRAQPIPAINYSLTLFQHRFDKLRSLDLTPSGITFNNNYEGKTTGLAGWGNWRVSDTWRLGASYVHQTNRFRARAGTAPLQGVASLGNDPRNRWSLSSSHDLGANIDFDVQLRRVGSLPSPAVPGYLAIDVRVGWQVRPDLELSLAVRNLGERRHSEWGNRVELERSVFLKAVWRM